MENSTIGPYTTIGDNSIIKNSKLSHTVILERSDLIPPRHDCWALIMIRYPETGVLIGPELQNFLADNKTAKLAMKDCPLNELNGRKFLDNMIDALEGAKG